MKSIPQVRNVQSPLECLCGIQCVYLQTKAPYACAHLPPKTCGVCFHEVDSLTYIHVNLADDETEDVAWLQLPRKAKHVCGLPGILKYRLNKNERGGELLYACRRSNACDEVEKDILLPAIYNGDEKL